MAAAIKVITMDAAFESRIMVEFRGGDMYPDDPAVFVGKNINAMLILGWTLISPPTQAPLSQSYRNMTATEWWLTKH